MTVGLLFAVVVRRWYVAVLGMCVTFATALAVHQGAGLYWTQVDVVFLAPASARYPNKIEQTFSSLIVTAGMVEAQLNNGHRMAATSSAGATLAGQGVRDGHLIRVPNSGGQWALNFDRPVLDVQVIGPNRDEVRTRLREITRRIDTQLYRIQARDGVAPGSFITTTSAPDSAQIFYLNGRPGRAAVATLLLGTAATALACVIVDGLLRRRALAPGRRGERLRESLLTR